MDLDSEIAREGGEKGREGEERAAGVFFYIKKDTYTLSACSQ